MSWQTKTIGEFCRTGSGGTPSRQQEAKYYGGGIPWVKSGELKESIITETEETITEIALKETSAKRIPAGSLLVAMYGATVGRIAILGIEATSNQAVCHIVPDKDVADQRYMFYALQRQVPKWLEQRVGGAQPNISQQIIRETKISLPPIAEQRRIAAILDRADAARRKRQAAIGLTEELLRSTFLEMFGDPGKNPYVWEIGSIADIAEKVTDGSHSTPERSDKGIMLLSARNIRNGYIDISEAVDFVALSEHERLKKSYAPLPHDVLISCSGSIGRVTVVRDFQPFSMVRSVAVVRPKLELMDSEFLETLLHTNYLQMAMNRGAKQSSQANLFQSAIKELPVIIPPLEMQQRWQILKSKLRETRNRYFRLQFHNNDLFNSLLQRAFRGEL